ncbi:MAG: hypothetical protein ABIT58_05455 [Ferruginibacter sp.]
MDEDFKSKNILKHEILFMKAAFIKLITIFILSPCFLHAQNSKLTCVDLRKGIFHMYPKNSADHYLIIRENEIVNEINTITGDSTLWEVKWPEDCVYSLKYISGSKKMDDKSRSFFEKHKLVYEVLNVTNDYYAFKGYIDNISSNPIVSDTIWLNEKATVVNNEIFKQIQNDPTTKPYLSDTSKYAILYVYRPGKIMNSLGNYVIYFDDNLMCIGKNNTGYIFKIFKEGNFELKSKLFKDESAVKINVKFGNVYYVKSMIHWGINKLYNFKLEMANVDHQVGQSEVLKVNLE